MTRIPKEGAEIDHEFDASDRQFDFFGPTPAEIAEIERVKAEADAKAEALKNESPEDKKRREWKERWDAGKATRDDKPNPLTIELAEYKKLREEDRAKIRELHKEISEKNQQIHQFKADIARLSTGLETQTFRGTHKGAPIEFEVVPRRIITLDIDASQKSALFELAITKAGTPYVRCPQRGSGVFGEVAYSGALVVRVVSVRDVIDPRESQEAEAQPETPPAPEASP